MNRVFEKNFNMPAPPTRFVFFTCRKCTKKWKQALQHRESGEVLPDFDATTICDECLEKMTCTTAQSQTQEGSSCTEPS